MTKIMKIHDTFISSKIRTSYSNYVKVETANVIKTACQQHRGGGGVKHSQLFSLIQYRLKLEDARSRLPHLFFYEVMYKLKCVLKNILKYRNSQQFASPIDKNFEVWQFFKKCLSKFQNPPQHTIFLFPQLPGSVRSAARKGHVFSLIFHIHSI